MDEETRKHIETLDSKDAEKRYQSFQWLVRQTQKPVDWAYACWDKLLDMLKTGDNHQRAIAGQLLSSLAKSDPEERLLRDLDRLMVVTHDERFVTARHTLQSLWKVGIAGKALQKKLMKALTQRFIECRKEKNCTLIRYDILQVMRRIYDQLPDETLKNTALALIGKEEDPKYMKKYNGLWKDLLKPERK